MDQDLPNVKSCTATDCAFNDCWSCRSPFIVVGDHEKPACNTYKKSDFPADDIDTVAEVKACNMFMCLRNRDLMCIAYHIKVRVRDGVPLCHSYKNRYK
jgi:hypothetical protein